MGNNKHSVLIDEDLYIEIKEFCDINSMKISEFITTTLKEELMVQKYGDVPFTDFKQPKLIINEEKKEENVETEEITEVEVNPQPTEHKKEEIIVKKRRLK